jgi:hypothetical protein
MASACPYHAKLLLRAGQVVFDTEIHTTNAFVTLHLNFNFYPINFGTGHRMSKHIFAIRSSWQSWHRPLQRGTNL